MIINTNSIVPMTDANQNFSKVVRLVEKEGMAVIMKNNKPKYIVVDFNEYEEIKFLIEERKRKIDECADKIIMDNLDAFRELAK
ncbi:type II toxin-antitoxin system Phd/YefM family antitoxin [Sedimentibacter sp.]|uniref:type II toxin-antitoxin system Phd/YefM family antitoxin n=1 Tax=Sedimentibacter sp. TaxID=1960295 RepID=UPI000EDF5F69|nr:type II toxin-antitoxin system Phd/YefM family antitoxin [Sedimentibacter sp.]HCX61497.1 type II toxin-antitoxin system prevent-host-death family antitoxin [Clostridiales bacterium]